MDYLLNSLIGTIAGVIEVTLLQPLVYFKNTTQQGKLHLTFNPSIIYRGVYMSMFNMSMMTGIQVPLSRLISTKIFNNNILPASIIGGYLSGYFCSPVELIIIQQQKHGYNMIKTSKYIINKYSVLKLLKGSYSGCFRESIFAFGYLGIAPKVSSYLINERKLSSYYTKLICALGLAPITAAISHPFDTIKTCMQSDINGNKSMKNTAIELYNEGGIRRFYNGYFWRASKMVGAFFILNETITRLTKVFFQ